MKFGKKKKKEVPEESPEPLEPPKEEGEKKELTEEEKQMKMEVEGFRRKYSRLYAPLDFYQHGVDFFKPEVCQLLFAIYMEIKSANENSRDIVEQLENLNRRLEESE